MARTIQFKFWPTLGTLIGLGILIALGTWQFNRYGEKLELEQKRDAQKQQPAVTITDVTTIQPEKLNYRRVKVTGTMDNARSVLFRHRQYQKRPGYWLGTPLVLSGKTQSGQAQALLINRGWVPKQMGDQFLKELMTKKASPQTFEGMLHIPHRIIPDQRTRLAVKKDKTKLKGAHLASYDLSLLHQNLPQTHPKTPMILVLDKKHSGKPIPFASLSYITKPYMTSDRHMSYFVFWYAMAVVLLGLYLGYTFGFVRSPKPYTSSN